MQPSQGMQNWPTLQRGRTWKDLENAALGKRSWAPQDEDRRSSGTQHARSGQTHRQNGAVVAGPCRWTRASPMSVPEPDM